MCLRGQGQGGGSGPRHLLTSYQFVVLAESGRFEDRVGSGDVAVLVLARGMMMVVTMAGGR